MEINENTRHVKLNSDNIEIEEIFINKEVDEYPEIRTDGDVTIIPVVREVEVVRIAMILEKEIHLTRNKKFSEEEVRFETRSEKVKITEENLTENENNV